MTIAVFNFNTGEIDIIKNAPDRKTDGGVELFLRGQCGYDMDMTEYLWNKEHPDFIKINYKTYPNDYRKRGE